MDSGSRQDLGNNPQLTLFPRVSKTTETKLRESRAIARKHFVKQCLLKNNESIVLTLMKGDEVVEGSEELTNPTLLCLVNGYR